MTNDEKNPNRPILTLNGLETTKSYSPTPETPVTAESADADTAVSLEKEEITLGEVEEQSQEKTQNKAESIATAEQQKASYEEILHYLQTHYPKCFPPESPVPMAIRIHEQVFAQNIPLFSKTAIRDFFRKYAKTPEYIKAKKNIRIRYNLDGTIADYMKQLDESNKQQEDQDKEQSTNQTKDKDLPHDSLFKRIMENDIAAKEFLNEYLPKEVKELIDLDSIKVQKESYIEPNLTKRFSDIVYAVDIKDSSSKAFIYVIAEHVRHEVAHIKSVTCG